MVPLPKRNSNDNFQKSMHNDIFQVNPSLPGKAPSLRISCSFDRYNELLDLLDRANTKCPLDIVLYDEERSINEKTYANIQELIRVLNNRKLNSIRIFMSDKTMPIYNIFMYNKGWQHQEKTKLFLSIDRNPLQDKKLNLQYASGQIMMPEEKLIWVPDYILRNLNDRIDPKLFEETKKLKRFLNNYNKQIKRTYRYQELTDLEKTLIVYGNLKESISFAMDRTMISPVTGIRVPINDPDNWQSRPYGTLNHKKGICEGQARLMVCMLNNPEMMVDASTINGALPSGERHTWVGIHSNNKLYECCTTMQGPFKNLQNKGYKADIDDQYINAYKRSFLTDNEYSDVCKGILNKKR